MRVFKTTWTNKNGDKIPTRNWYIEFRDHLQIIQRLTAFTDKSLSEALGRKIVRLVNCKIAGENLDLQLSCWLEQIPDRLRNKFVEIGLIDKGKAALGSALRKHLEDFKQSLLAKANTAGYVNTVIARTGRVINGCGFKYWSDITASEVEHYLSELRNGGQGISAQTFNFYLQAIKQFCKWMVNDRRAAESPIRHLKGLNVRTDRRHDRRALEPEEIRRLLKVTKVALKRFGMTGYERALLYRLAIETGLRRGELRSLTGTSFDFENCSVTVGAAYSKNRTQSTIPLKKDTALEMEQFLKDKPPKTPVFGMPYKTANMLKADLSAAGIPYVDDTGRYVDFHSLRHSTGSLLAANGVHPKVIQSIMRHSDINLTMSRYTHLFQGQESEAIAKLPDLSSPKTDGPKAMATGTDGK